MTQMRMLGWDEKTATQEAIYQYVELTADIKILQAPICGEL
ncbi:MAG TPA: hypothetical protein VD815_07695 [Candidatus Saccharimonadales bacterium]|nr:hypothetical protein [Candidatus Saccharimonadales bacterium]